MNKNTSTSAEKRIVLKRMAHKSEELRRTTNLLLASIALLEVDLITPEMAKEIENDLFPQTFKPTAE